MSIYENKKLRISSSALSGDVFVIQDGTAADATATAKFDNGFRAGMGAGSTHDREWVSLQTLENDDGGRTLTFRVMGRKSWLNGTGSAIRVQPNDKVELWADRGTTTGVTGFPSWHMDSAGSGQKRIFLGWVASVTPNANDGSVVVVCRDGLWRANDVTLNRDTANGLEIPKIVFNPRIDSDDFYFGVKKTNVAGGATIISTGQPKSDNFQLTVSEILQYLQANYQTALENIGVLPLALSGALFNSSDIAGLTIKPTEIVLENVGFIDGLKQILNWVPNVKLLIDHQTGQFRLVPYEASLSSTVTTTTGAEQAIGSPSTYRYPVASVTGFSGGDKVRFYDATDPSISLLRTVQTVYPGTPAYLGFADTQPYFTNGTRIAKVDANVLPTVDFSISTGDVIDFDTSLDLEDAFSAVSIYSVNQTTETKTFTYTAATFAASPYFQPAWDNQYESVWKDKDADREADLGADGVGCKVYRITSTTTGGTARDTLWIAYEDTQYSADHTSGEWNGCSVWVWTENQTAIDRKDAATTFNIYDQTVVSDVGNGKPGLKIVLNVPTGNFLANFPQFYTINAGGTPDRVVLTQSYRFSTTTQSNRRWQVGRKFVLNTNTISQSNSTAPHVTTCSPAKVQSDNGNGTSRNTPIMKPNLGYPQANLNWFGEWTSYANAASAGATGIYYVPNGFYTQAPVGSACASGTGWQRPRSFTVTIEQTTTTMRTARYPVSGYAGEAFERFNLQREKRIATNAWLYDSQDAEYQDLAQRIFESVSHANTRGNVTLRGIKEHGTLLDLAFRATLSSTRHDAGTAATVLGFWGISSACRLDFERDALALTFQRRSPLLDMAVKLFEDVGVELASKVETQRTEIQKMQEELRCLLGSRIDAVPQQICADRVYEPTGRPVPPTIKLPRKDNQQNRINETGFGLTDGGGAFTTHGGRAYDTVVRDLRGTHFLIDGQGAITPGTVSGSEFTRNTSSPATPYGLPERLQDEAAASMAFMGLDARREAHAPIYGHTKASSTTTAIKVAAPYLENTATAGALLYLLDFTDRAPRPAYTVSSITGNDTINLSAAMAEAAPATGVAFVLVPAPLTPLKAADFGSNAVGAYTAAGQSVVYQPGTSAGDLGSLFATTTVSGELTKKASGSATAVDVPVGFAEGNAFIDLTHKPVGSWNFGTATVALTASATVGTVYVADSSGLVAGLGPGTNGYVLTADSAQPLGVKWAAGGGGGGGATSGDILRKLAIGL
jgi:hypothetical protein